MVILSSIRIWSSPEDIILSEIIQIQREKYHMILVTCGVQKASLIQVDINMVIEAGGWVKMRKCWSKRTLFQLGGLIISN